MSGVPRVAVLLAAYNGALWIEEQLASIEAQQGVSVTLFISVDDSSDDTLALCQRYQQLHPHVQVLTPAGPFGGAARNFFHLLKVVDLNRFDFIAFSDQDDRWYSDKLLRATRRLTAAGEAAYSSNVTAFWPDGRRVLLDKAQPQVPRDYLFEAAGPGCTYVLSRAFAVRLQSEVCNRWAELQAVTLHDWYIYAFARSHGYRWYIDPVSSMDYRQHPANLIGANVGVRSLVARYRTIRSGWWLAQVRLIARLVGVQDDAWVASWLKMGRRQMLTLAGSAGQCRRRRRDQYYFKCLCLAIAVIGMKPE